MSGISESLGLAPADINQLFIDHFASAAFGQSTQLEKSLSVLQQLGTPFIKETVNASRFVLDTLRRPIDSLPIVEESVYWGVRAYTYSGTELDPQVLATAATVVDKPNKWLKRVIKPSFELLIAIDRSIGKQLEGRELRYYHRLGHNALCLLGLARSPALIGRQLGKIATEIVRK